MIDDEALPAPKRTFTFIWGAELMMAKLWKHENKAAFDATVAALVLDMVGEDPTKTGGPMRIEKMPDPAAVYQYGLDELPGLEQELPDAYVRLPDLHSLWGQGTVEVLAVPGPLPQRPLLQVGRARQRHLAGVRGGLEPLGGRQRPRQLRVERDQGRLRSQAGGAHLALHRLRVPHVDGHDGHGQPARGDRRGPDDDRRGLPAGHRRGAAGHRDHGHRGEQGGLALRLRARRTPSAACCGPTTRPRPPAPHPRRSRRRWPTPWPSRC